MAMEKLISPKRTDIKKRRTTFNVSKGVAGIKILFVNAYIVSNEDKTWVLVDAGLSGSAKRIKQAAEELFGENASPEAILLTHGHFDHVGALKELAEEWNVPVYAHALEMPYLSGLSSYPPPDPTVGGGAMAYMSWLYPNKPINLGDYLHFYPADGTVPFLPGWKLIHTPGHTAGHVSFFRESDGTLIAGDAFVTTKQESLRAVIFQRKEIHGPPSYFTSDWQAAEVSVRTLNNLHPDIAATGHGVPMEGEVLKKELENLAVNFFKTGRPSYGRYVNAPAFTNEHGIVALPPPILNFTGKITLGLAIATFGLAVLAGIYQMRKKD
jgi:glyoxylase-like metal-dependent hydrolase (beta-lactamase superfamily II)